MNFNDKPYEYLLERIKDLERELAAAQDEIKRLRGKCAAIEGNEIGYPCVALSEAQAQRDEMKLALRDLTDAFEDYGGPTYSNVYKNALKALGWDAGNDRICPGFY